MKIKTSELIGAQLDWAVAKCEHSTIHVAHFNDLRSLHVLHREFYYSTNWSQGGPIIERERFVVEPWGLGWVASVSRGILHHGPTPLIAAMRCYVASKMGDEVEAPEELT